MLLGNKKRRHHNKPDKRGSSCSTFNSGVLNGNIQEAKYNPDGDPYKLLRAGLFKGSPFYSPVIC